nr:MAG: replication initiator protein [Microviridae sp.]
MSCTHPITAYQVPGLTPKGVRPVLFGKQNAFKARHILVPCGNCIGCRLDRARMWAVRCVHEASLHHLNCFITLTYNNDHNPITLNKRDFVLFMKKLRKKYGKNIRFFHAGEYGERLGRPHHHACIFNFDFSDKKLVCNKNGCNLYKSQSLEKLWGKGFTSLADVTFDSAAYVAKYILKKINGTMAIDHYKGKQPEYSTMSRRPGIAHDWFVKYKNDVTAIDGVLLNNIIFKPPKYYDSLYDVTNHNDLIRIKQKRINNINSKKNTYEQIIIRKKIYDINLSKTQRRLEDYV